MSAKFTGIMISCRHHAHPSLVEANELRMFSDVDYSQPDVREDVLNWGVWITKELGLAGMRIDAVKHISSAFIKDFIDHINKHCGPDFFIVGENFNHDSKALAKYMDEFDDRMYLYDIKLMYNIFDAAEGNKTDLCTIFDDSLVRLRPHRTMVSTLRHGSAFD